MKKIIALLFYTFLCAVCQADDSLVVFVDSLTGAELVFPSEAIIKVSDKEGFYKCKASFPKGELVVYSMKNLDGKQYSWNVINKFDANDKYGTFINGEKIEGLNIEGWYRYYEQKSESGRSYLNCVTALRGKDYAIYFLESVFNKEDLVSPSVVEASTFIGPSDAERSITKYNNYWAAIMLITALLPFLLYFVRKKMSDTLKNILIITFSIIGTIAVILLSLSWWVWIIAIILYLSIWYTILYAKNWTDVWNVANKILEHL